MNTRKILALAIVLAVVVAGCSSDNDEVAADVVEYQSDGPVVDTLDGAVAYSDYILAFEVDSETRLPPPDDDHPGGYTIDRLLNVTVIEVLWQAPGRPPIAVGDSITVRGDGYWVSLGDDGEWLEPREFVGPVGPIANGDQLVGSYFVPPSGGSTLSNIGGLLWRLEAASSRSGGSPATLGDLATSSFEATQDALAEIGARPEIAAISAIDDIRDRLAQPVE